MRTAQVISDLGIRTAENDSAGVFPVASAESSKDEGKYAKRDDLQREGNRCIV